MKIIGLIWILIENSLISGTYVILPRSTNFFHRRISSFVSRRIFGFASLFSVLPRYGIYGEKCKTSSGIKDCQDQMAEYQVRLKIDGREKIGLIMFIVSFCFGNWIL